MWCNIMRRNISASWGLAYHMHNNDLAFENDSEAKCKKHIHDICK